MFLNHTMGLCLCKEKDSSKTCCGCSSSSCPCCFNWGKTRSTGDLMSNGNGRQFGGSAGHRGDTLGSDRTTSSAASDSNFIISHLSPQVIDCYVLETLKVLRTLVGKWVHFLRFWFDVIICSLRWGYFTTLAMLKHHQVWSNYIKLLSLKKVYYFIYSGLSKM